MGMTEPISREVYNRLLPELAAWLPMDDLEQVELAYTSASLVQKFMPMRRDAPGAELVQKAHDRLKKVNELLFRRSYWWWHRRRAKSQSRQRGIDIQSGKW
jgi:hypothetical protein